MIFWIAGNFGWALSPTKRWMAQSLVIKRIPHVSNFLNANNLEIIWILIHFPLDLNEPILHCWTGAGIRNEMNIEALWLEIECTLQNWNMRLESTQNQRFHAFWKCKSLHEGNVHWELKRIGINIINLLVKSKFIKPNFCFLFKIFIIPTNPAFLDIWNFAKSLQFDSNFA